MGKKINEVAYYVKITPRRLGHLGFARVNDSLISDDPLRDYRENCEAMLDQVKRHVDGVGHVEVEAETEAVCSECGRMWTETSTVYNGGCCDEDEKGNPNA